MVAIKEEEVVVQAEDVEGWIQDRSLVHAGIGLRGESSCWGWSSRHQLAAVPVPSLLKYLLFLPPILGREFGPAASFVMWWTT